MDTADRLAAIEAIRDLKAKYWRGVDTGDAALVCSILAADCVLDYRQCCLDPASGVDHMPQMNIVLHGRASWPVPDPAAARPVTVHQGHQSEIEITGEDTASGLWLFTDRFFMPAGSRFSRLTGHGYYHDTYSRDGGRWLLATTRITRLRVATD